MRYCSAIGDMRAAAFLVFTIDLKLNSLERLICYLFEITLCEHMTTKLFKLIIKHSWVINSIASVTFIGLDSLKLGQQIRAMCLTMRGNNLFLNDHLVHS